MAGAIPVLRITSPDQAFAFYRDFLGFHVVWEHRFADGMPLYAEIRRDDLVLHLSEHSGDGLPGMVVFLPVADIGAWRESLQPSPSNPSIPEVESVDWGLQMTLADPFGNRLRVCQLE